MYMSGKSKLAELKEIQLITILTNYSKFTLNRKYYN